MPSRRRPKAPVPHQQDPVTRFGALLRESDERDRAERDRRQRQRDEDRRAAVAAVERAAALEGARRQLDRAIEDARAARVAGVGVAAADAEWRGAKAHVIELETGAPPAWAAATPERPSTE